LNSSFAMREDGMGRFLIVLGAQFLLAAVLLGALEVPVVAQLAPSSAPSDSSEPVTVQAASGSPSRCNSEDIVEELAIERLHPEFVTRLANAIREAREAGLTGARIFSAYRPPAFGVGGFVDKFNSLHTYHPVEWNHCQPTRVKIILAENPLRGTVTADGPIKLEGMFEAGKSIIDRVADAAAPTASDLPALISKVQENRRRSQRVATLHPRLHDGASVGASINSGPKIISVEEGRQMLRLRSSSLDTFHAHRSAVVTSSKQTGR
jgi:hypothetical protein